MSPQSITKVRAQESREGSAGQRCLATGSQLGMRLWQDEPAGLEKPVSRRDYETVGYVLNGRAELQIDGQLVTLEPGDSWVVPRGTAHRYRILERFTAVEATSPPEPGGKAGA